MGLGGIGNMCSRDETMWCSQLDIDSLIDILGWSTIISTASTNRSALPYKEEWRSPKDQRRPAHRVGNSGAAGAAPAYQRRRVEKQQPRSMRVDKKNNMLFFTHRQLTMMILKQLFIFSKISIQNSILSINLSRTQHVVVISACDVSSCTQAKKNRLNILGEVHKHGCQMNQRLVFSRIDRGWLTTESACQKSQDAQRQNQGGT